MKQPLKPRLLLQFLFGPRKLPSWWTQFVSSNPFFPNLISVIGLAWICYSFGHNLDLPKRYPDGSIVDMVRTVSGSQFIVDKVISLRATYHQLFSDEIRIIFSNIFTNWVLWLVIPFLLVLEILFPCNPSQPLIGKG